MNTLPELTSAPNHHPDCCCSLSIRLVNTLVNQIPMTPTFCSIISIGSGTGLLEAILLHKRPTLSIKAIEVSHTINKYMLENDLCTLLGTWSVCPLAADAQVWLFVYPREVNLLRRYTQSYGSQTVELIIWIGPRADFADYAKAMCLSGWILTVFKDCGLSKYELMATWEKSPDYDIVGGRSSMVEPCTWNDIWIL